MSEAWPPSGVRARPTTVNFLPPRLTSSPTPRSFWFAYARLSTASRLLAGESERRLGDVDTGDGSGGDIDVLRRAGPAFEVPAFARGQLGDDALDVDGVQRQRPRGVLDTGQATYARHPARREAQLPRGHEVVAGELLTRLAEATQPHTCAAHLRPQRPAFLVGQVLRPCLEVDGARDRQVGAHAR